MQQWPKHYEEQKVDIQYNNVFSIHDHLAFLYISSDLL